MPKLIMLVGPPGSGKSTFAYNLVHNDGDHGAVTVWINQDRMGKLEHMTQFRDALYSGKDIIVDRMNFNKIQRLGYIEQARASRFGYEIDIHVFHEPRAVCLSRAIERKNHETIKDDKAANNAIDFFFRNYERVEDGEADRVVRHYSEIDRPVAIWCDLDGTLADCSHRQHYVRVPEGQKKNWQSFFAGIKDDKVNKPIAQLLRAMGDSHKIVYCSGRGEEYRKVTEEWLEIHKLDNFYDSTWETYIPADLYMRPVNTQRQDAIVKEILLDFEILTRYEILFCLDDRDQVVKMLRRRGLTVFQVAEGDF